MLRCFAIIMFAASIAAQTAVAQAAQPSQEKGTGEPAPASATASNSGSPVEAGFPLDQFKDFSAIMVGSILRGDERESHIYRSDNLLRMQGTEGRGYFIADLTAYETYGLTAMGCLKDKHQFFRAFPFSASRPSRKVERVVAGQETIDGHECQIEDVTVSAGDLVVPIKLRIWEAADLHGFPVKVQILNGTGQNTIRYKNVVLGPADPTLFVIPKHCSGGLPEPEKAHPTAKKPQSGASTGNTQK